MKHITEDIFNEAMNGLDPALVAEHISKREELESNKTRPARTYRLRRAAIAAVAAAAIAAGAAGAVFIANRAPEPGAVSEESAGEAVNNSGENVSADDSGESDPDLPGTSSAESGPEALPSPYVNGVFFPYIYVDNLFHDMDVIKMFVPQGYTLNAEISRAILKPLSVGVLQTELAMQTNTERRREPYIDDPRNKEPRDRRINDLGILLYHTEGYSDYIDPMLAIKIHYFPEEERYATLLTFRILHSKDDAEYALFPEEAAQYVYEKTGEMPEMRPVLMYNDYFEIEYGYDPAEPVWEGRTFYGTFTAEQIKAFAEGCVRCLYVSTGIGNSDDLTGLQEEEVPTEYRKTHSASEYAGRFWYNRLIEDPDCLDERMLKALKYACECMFERFEARDDGIHLVK